MEATNKGFISNKKEMSEDIVTITKIKFDLKKCLRNFQCCEKVRVFNAFNACLIALSIRHNGCANDGRPVERHWLVII